VVAVGATSSAYDTRLHFTIQDAFVESISNTQRAWLKRLEVLSERAKVARRGAQDAGILPPPIGPLRPRPRYKAALLGRLSFYHLIRALHALIGPHVAHLPISARPGLTTRVTPLMTWWVKPRLAQLTSTWRPGQHATAAASGGLTDG
jgi:antibiotic biosynthesis monooxygenase (ABM) superfamily enzyme